MGAREAAILGLAGGVLALDRTAFLQSMASRPLVASTAAGYLLADPALGLLCGLLLELLWLMDLPVGTSVPANETLAALLATAFAVSAPRGWSAEARASLGVLTALPFGLLGRWLDIAVRRWNGRLVERVRANAAAGKPLALGRAQAAGALRLFLVGAVATAVGSAAGGRLVAEATPRFPAAVVAALELAETALPLIGVAAVLAGLGRLRHAALFAFGFAGGLWGGHRNELAELIGKVPWPR